MTLIDELLEIERGFWNATRDPRYYREHMADDGVAIFGIGVMDKDEAIASTSAPQMSEWTDVELSHARLIELGDDHAALVYQGRAKRDGEPYAANSTTVYARRGGEWRLVVHQQSPVVGDGTSDG
ncbi:MAG: nuclear transport factor 2 family protein [Dehalococcoidia bacterium]